MGLKIEEKDLFNIRLSLKAAKSEVKGLHQFWFS